MLSNYGRGNSAKYILNNTSNSFSCPPSPSIDPNEHVSVASGRAAQVLRQIKQSASLKILKELSDNQLLIQCAITPWYKYKAEFQPSVSSRTTRFNMMNKISKNFNDLNSLFDGEFVYFPHQLSKECFTFDDSKLNINYEIRIRFIDTINIEQLPIDCINALFRLAIDRGKDLNINAINRKARHWAGRIAEIERVENGLLLTIDFLSKTTRATCYEELERCYMLALNNDYKELAKKEFINKLVLTRYNNRTERIDNIDFEVTPATFKFIDNSQATLIDYYLNKFDIKIKDPDQPLLVYYPRRPREISINSEKHYLVPELCYLTSLSDRAHRDARARKINHHVPLNSIARQTEISYFEYMLRQNPETRKYLQQWCIDIPSNTALLHSSMNKSIRIYHCDVTTDDDDENEENNKQDHYDWFYVNFIHPIELKFWLLIYAKVDHERVLNYVNILRQVSQQQGMLINEPTYVQIDDDETESYVNAIRNNVNNQIQLVSTIVKSRRIDRYNAIKRLCCIEMPIATEIILRSTIADDDNLPNIVLNITRDINFKLGGMTRPMNIHMANTMLIGLATWTSANVNYHSLDHLEYVLSIVGSINYSMTEYFSHVKSYNNESDLRSDIGNFVELAIKAYYQENKIYPTTIILGRNVYSSFDDLNMIKENEIQLIIDMIKNKNTMSDDYKPRLIIFALMKHIIYDSYKYVQSKKTANIGCFVAKDSPSYCFYLSSYRDRSSTLRARQFLVLFDNTGLSAKKVQRIILYLTLHVPQHHQFFFPSICRFAQRLSALVGETLGEPPKFDRYKNLFYL